MISVRIPRAIGALLAASAMLAGATASAAALPGGASSLTETYGDWGVACQMQAKAPACSVRQVQTNSQTKQILLTIEIGKESDGQFHGALFLPLGVSLKQGARLTLDEAALGNALPFSTCLPRGCLVPLTFETSTIGKLKSGKALQVAVFAEGTAQPVSFSVSLKGFAAALNRVTDLTK